VDQSCQTSTQTNVLYLISRLNAGSSVNHINPGLLNELDFRKYSELSNLTSSNYWKLMAVRNFWYNVLLASLLAKDRESSYELFLLFIQGYVHTPQQSMLPYMNLKGIDAALQSASLLDLKVVVFDEIKQLDFPYLTEASECMLKTYLSERSSILAVPEAYKEIIGSIITAYLKEQNITFSLKA
jgi:hypothetical protein